MLQSLSGGIKMKKLFTDRGENLMKKSSTVFIAAVLFLGFQGKPDEVRERFKRADREFSKLSEAQGPLQAFLTYLTDKAYLLHPDEISMQGQNAIIAQYGSYPKGATLTWEPTDAECSETGEIGYTLGKYFSKRVGQDGIPRMREGSYLTVWKRQADSSLKVIADMGEPAPMPQEAIGVVIARIPFNTERSSTGDFGVAFGTFQMRIQKIDGKDSLAYGKYVHAWRKQPDGSMKTQLDMSNASPIPK